MKKHKSIKKLNTNVLELFKEFCKERHAEDKGRNFNLLQEIYASTELFDLSFLPPLKTSSLANMRDYEVEGNELIVKSELFIDLCLPFESIFIKVKETDSLIPMIFMREYSPTVISGTFHVKYELGTTVNAPFWMNTETGSVSIDITGFKQMVKAFENMHNKHSFVDVIKTVLLGEIDFAITHITNLPKHSVVSDKPAKAEYYTRKHADTIKVIRPIYYVLDKKEEKKPVQLRMIKPIGHLEFSHAFKVRCHWRKINEDSLGKDRNGERKIKGMTFVEEYIKGEGELVKKIRILK